MSTSGLVCIVLAGLVLLSSPYHFSNAAPASAASAPAPPGTLVGTMSFYNNSQYPSGFVALHWDVASGSLVASDNVTNIASEPYGWISNGYFDTESQVLYLIVSLNSTGPYFLATYDYTTPLPVRRSVCSLSTIQWFPGFGCFLKFRGKLYLEVAQTSFGTTPAYLHQIDPLTCHVNVVTSGANPLPPSQFYAGWQHCVISTYGSPRTGEQVYLQYVDYTMANLVSVDITDIAADNVSAGSPTGYTIYNSPLPARTKGQYDAGRVLWDPNTQYTIVSVGGAQAQAPWDVYSVSFPSAGPSSPGTFFSLTLNTTAISAPLNLAALISAPGDEYPTILGTTGQPPFSPVFAQYDVKGNLVWSSLQYPGGWTLNLFPGFGTGGGLPGFYSPNGVFAPKKPQHGAKNQ